MSWINTTNGAPVPVKDIPVHPYESFSGELSAMIATDKRLVSLFGARRYGYRIPVYAIFADDDNSQLHIASFEFPEEGGAFPSLSPSFPGLYNFERELFEQTGILPQGHPSLCPLRKIFEKNGERKPFEKVPLSHVDGEESHEVGVGPVHAGVIEPGHFRFSCIGETVYILEMHLGYQHRGIERLFCEEGAAVRRTKLAESIAGDTTIGHGIAYAQAAEGLASQEAPYTAQAIRGIALELERASVHTGDLAALSGDIAYLPGNAVFGATRTILINTMLAICGSRFGRNLIREGGVCFGIDNKVKETILINLIEAKSRIELAARVLFSSPGVLSRFDSTGTVSFEDAKTILLTGPAARACGLSLDVRTDHPAGIYKHHPMHTVTLGTGDVFARAFIRYAEIMRSFEFIEYLLGLFQEGELESGTGRRRGAVRGLCPSLRADPSAAKNTFSQDELVLLEGKTWVPIEITMIRDGFLNAWKTGAREWRANKQSTGAKLYPVHTAWSLYRPTGLLQNTSRVLTRRRLFPRPPAPR